MRQWLIIYASKTLRVSNIFNIDPECKVYFSRTFSTIIQIQMVGTALTQNGCEKVVIIHRPRLLVLAILFAEICYNKKQDL